MKLTLAVIAGSPRKLRSGAGFSLVEEYLQRASVFAECSLESFEDEAALLQSLQRRVRRVPASLLIFDSRGTVMSSEEFARRLGELRDAGQQSAMVAVGPASGWTALARERADAVISLGNMTLPHALAQVVVAEQIYRALTILARHPYHSGH